MHFVVQGSKEKEKGVFMKTSCTIQVPSTQLLGTFASMPSMELWGFDYIKLYPERNIALSCSVYIVPEKELGLGNNRLYRIVKAPHGLAEADHYWQFSLRQVVEGTLRMLPSPLMPPYPPESRRKHCPHGVHRGR